MLSLEKSMIAKPFLKWAGGKGQLIEQMNSFLPNGLTEGSIAKYIEPFVGGGAVFLYLVQNYPIKEVFIFDVNIELVIAYRTIQHSVEKLIPIVLDIQNKYLSLDENERKTYFYQIRAEFNLQRNEIDVTKYNSTWIERTAQIIFLNRTCFNGLFRVNSNGDFNVPIGKYKKPNICDKTNLKAVSEALQKTQIHYGDFSECEQYVDGNTFVYFDPPYRPISKTSNFTSYSQNIFDDSEQLRLRDFFKSLDAKGAKLLLSNSDPKNEDINDDFFDNAYAGYRIERAMASRNINCNASKRKPIKEILIMNY
ncbi:DNA adenine methylase [Scytonema sp. NUACC26]|uniref:DNA adenine methylase n=1 Tax=Scytonema sp. NUACC26 TaxID=3140176 RepID=UPI0034DC85C8